MPVSFAEARDEHEYWESRDDELGLIFDQSGLGFGDTALDMAVQIRAEAVRDLVLKDLPVTTLADLHARFALYRDLESHDDKIESALFRDLTTMVEAERHLSRKYLDSADQAQPPEPFHFHSSPANAGIEKALRADPSRSDRAIAREAFCSPTTVGKIRRGMGLHTPVRRVQRLGTIYRMAVARGDAGTRPIST